MLFHWGDEAQFILNSFVSMTILVYYILTELVEKTNSIVLNIALFLFIVVYANWILDKVTLAKEDMKKKGDGKESIKSKK